LASAFDAVSAYNEQAANLVGGGEAERVLVGRVNSDFLRVAVLNTIIGRSFTAQDFEAGRQYVALLTASLWRQHYGGSTDILGRTVLLDDRSYTVVGVIGDDFKAPTQITTGRGISIE